MTAKYGIAGGKVKCVKCNKEFFKPKGCKVKKCDWCGTKFYFKEKHSIHPLTGFDVWKPVIDKVLEKKEAQK